MFRALGQIMHLVVDASVPLHVRNDEHPLGLIFGNYEHWVQTQHGRPGSPEEPNFINTFLSNPFRFDTSILQQPTNDSKAPVPVARLLDTDTYRGSDPNVTQGTAIGIAEFANANFFSEDTGDGQYPFPNVNTLLPTQRQTVQTARVRAYYTKAPGDGVAVDPVLAECVLDELAVSEVLPVSRIGTCTDENVWTQIASIMLPRAVGYAGGVLDYFFRGTLDFTIGASSPNQTLTITNKSEEAMEGTFTLYADNFSEVRSSVDSFALNLGPMAPSGPLTFTPPGEVQAYTLVFQGKLGLEEGAVAGKVNEWYAVTDVTPGSITPGQPATINITIKSSFRRQQQTLVAALFDGNAVELASTSAVVPNSGPTTTNISLEVTPTTIPSSAPPPISLVVASEADIATITPADLSNQAAGDPMTLVRVGQASRLPIYQRVMSSCQAKIRSVAFASDAQSSGTPTLTISAPANLQDGDILLGHVFFGITLGIPVITEPSGFMVVGFDFGEPNVRMSASSKVALGEGGSFTWTATNVSGNHWIAFGALIAISGANTSNYEDIDVDDQSFLWTDITPTLTNTTIIRMGIASRGTPFTITGPSAPYEELYNEILTLPGGSPWFGASFRWFGYSMESNAAEANSASVQADPPALGRHGYSVAVMSGTCL